MDIQPANLFPRPEKSLQKSGKDNDPSQLQFDQVLSSKVSEAEAGRHIQATEGAIKQTLRRSKEIIETGEGLDAQEEEPESIGKTVKDLKKKIKALKNLERQILGY